MCFVLCEAVDLKIENFAKVETLQAGVALFIVLLRVKRACKPSDSVVR